jgi:lipoprotein-anchoring transpeptidase ErfK/SrfK
MARSRVAAGLAGRVGRSGICIALVAGAVWLLAAAPAFALTVTAPANTGTSLAATVTVDAAESAGQVDLLVDGSVAATAAVLPGTDSGFTALPLTPGRHILSATLHGNGGDVTASDVIVTAWAPPSPPQLLSPSGPAISWLATAIVRAGANTTSVRLLISYQDVRAAAVTPGTVVRFDNLGLPTWSPWVVYTVVVSNPIGQTGVYEWGFRRIDPSSPTMIVIEKSQYQLHWIVDYQLVRTYPIAHGRGNSTPVGTWKVGAKYTSDPRGIYGPRKMRLYRLRSGRRGRPGRWQSSSYLIHGTNQPWVIGSMASHGCIRMYNWDVLDLWPQVPIGTPVETRR